MGWLSNLFRSPPKPTRYVTLEGDGSYRCPVVGESQYQDALGQITGGKTEDGHEFECVAVLEPEPSNPYDSNAVAVRINGQTVGYLSKPLARAMCVTLKQHNLAGVQVGAVVVGGWASRKGRKPEGHYGVKLDIAVS